MEVYKNKFSTGEDITIKLNKYDKWWLKKLIKKENYPEEEFYEIGFYFDKKYPVPILNDEREPEHIEVYSKEEIEDVLNSKSRVRKNFYYIFYEGVYVE